MRDEQAPYSTVGSGEDLVQPCAHGLLAASAWEVYRGGSSSFGFLFLFCYGFNYFQEFMSLHFDKLCLIWPVETLQKVFLTWLQNDLKLYV